MAACPAGRLNTPIYIGALARFTLNKSHMIFHYIRIAFRNIFRYAGTSMIKVISLSLGLLSAAFILLYFNSEKKFDHFHSDIGQMYRVVVDQKSPTTHHALALSAGPMAPALDREFEEVESFVRAAKSAQQVLVSTDQHRFYETSLIYADSNFFNFFDFPLLQGNAESCLIQNQSLVLSKSMAQKYFGNSNPINRQLTIDSRLFTVTGMMADIPENSHLQFSMVIPLSNFSAAAQSNWRWFPLYSYLKLSAKTDLQHLLDQLPEFIKKYVPESPDNTSVSMSLQPVAALYLSQSRLGEPGPHGNSTILKVLWLIALVILVISGLNFINISTAQSVNQYKEVGVRKISGASTFQMLVRFCCESLFLSIVSFGVSLIGMAFLMPWFLELSGRSEIFNWSMDMDLLLTFFAGSIVMGLLAGLYPSLILSNFRPVAILNKFTLTGTSKKWNLKSGLVILQFTISSILVISVFTIYTQLDYLRSKDLGFIKEHMVVINFGNDTTIVHHREAIRNELLNLSGVTGVSFSSHQPGASGHGLYTVVEMPDGQSQQGEISLYLVDHEFIDHYGLQLIAGQKFDPRSTRDTTAALIINETALSTFGFNSAEAAIGQEFAQWDRQGKIIGVVKDFNYQSLHSQIEPLSFQVWPEKFESLSVRVIGNAVPKVIEDIGEKWSRLLPHLPMDYHFLDEAFDQQYHKDERFGKVFMSFAIVALLISSLGLLGLSLFSLNLKIKEVAIRKVHGAAITNIFGWLITDFVKQVLIGFLLAVPIAYMLCRLWLQQYAYQVSISIETYGVALLTGLLVALITIIYQVVKASSANPVKFLQHH